MQTVYRFIYGKIYQLTKHISEIIRFGSIFACYLIVCIGFFSDRVGESYYFGRDMILGSIIVMIISLLNVDREPGKIIWNKRIYLPMVSFGTGLLLIGQLHHVGDGYMMYALDMIFIFPAFYFVQISTKSIERGYRLLALSAVSMGIASYIYCWILALQGDLMEPIHGRFWGYFNNVNSLGMVGVITFIAGLYLILEHYNKWIKLLAAVAVGIGIGYAFLSISRSAFLCEAICIIVFLAFIVKRYIAGVSATTLKCAFAYVIIASIVMGAGTLIVDLNHWARQHKEGPSAESGILLTAEAATDEVMTSERNDTDEEVPDNITRNNRPEISDGLDAFTSGRTRIWRIYISNFSWFGMDIRDLSDQFAEGESYRAHNNIIDYTLRCGYIVGFLYLVFFIAVGIKGLMILFSRRHISAADFFLVSIIGAYSIQALVEVATLPFTRIIPCIFFLTIAPLMGRSEDEEAGDTLEK